MQAKHLVAIVALFAICQGAAIAMDTTGSRTQVAAKTPLPHARGKTFLTLDDYLEHLRKKGTMDIPYYELQPDGRYRLITGRGGNRVPPVYFKRSELMAKFGFSK